MSIFYFMECGLCRVVDCFASFFLFLTDWEKLQLTQVTYKPQEAHRMCRYTVPRKCLMEKETTNSVPLIPTPFKQFRKYSFSSLKSLSLNG